MVFPEKESKNIEAIKEYNTTNKSLVIIILVILIIAALFATNKDLLNKMEKEFERIYKTSQNRIKDDEIYEGIYDDIPSVNDIYMNNYEEDNLIIDEKDADYVSDYKSVKDLTIGKYYMIKASKLEKYSYTMYLSRNSSDGYYASFIYYFPDQTRIIVNLPPTLLIKDDKIYDFCVKGKLTKDTYGVRDYKMDIDKTGVIYANNAEFVSEEPININTIKSVKELVEGQYYFFSTKYFSGEIEEINGPNYLIYNLPDGNEIWFNIEDDGESFNRRNVYTSGYLSIEKRFEMNDDTGFTVYIIK